MVKRNTKTKTYKKTKTNKKTKNKEDDDDDDDTFSYLSSFSSFLALNHVFFFSTFLVDPSPAPYIFRFAFDTLNLPDLR